MPETKLTPARLREHVRKHFIVYAVGIVACLILTNLLWTTTAPRIPSNQTIVIYMADAWSNAAPLDPIAADILERLQADTDILEVDFQALQFTDPSQDYTGSMLLMTRMSTGEGDAFLCNSYCMDALVNAGVVMPLDELVEGGWLSGFDLEPWYATVVDGETGEETTFLAGLRLDSVDRLAQMGAFNNEGAFLALLDYTENTEETMRAMEYLLEDLQEAGDASADRTE